MARFLEKLREKPRALHSEDRIRFISFRPTLLLLPLRARLARPVDRARKMQVGRFAARRRHDRRVLWRNATQRSEMSGGGREGGERRDGDPRCDLAVFVNRHTLPSCELLRTIAIARERATPRERLSFPRVHRAMEVEPMCIVENETVSAPIFRRYARARQCARAWRKPAMGKTRDGPLRARTAGLHHIMQRGRPLDGTGLARVRRSWRHARIAIVPTPQLASIAIARGRRAGVDEGVAI